MCWNRAEKEAEKEKVRLEREMEKEKTKQEKEAARREREVSIHDSDRSQCQMSKRLSLFPLFLRVVSMCVMHCSLGECTQCKHGKTDIFFQLFSNMSSFSPCSASHDFRWPFALMGTQQPNGWLQAVLYLTKTVQHGNA